MAANTNVLLVGDTFASLSELQQARLEFGKRNFVTLHKRYVKTLESAKKDARKRVESAKAELHYYHVRPGCW